MLTQYVIEQPSQIVVQIQQEQVGIAFFYARPVTLFWPPALSSLSRDDKQTAVCLKRTCADPISEDQSRQKEMGKNVAFGLNPWDPVRFAGVSVVNRNLRGGGVNTSTTRGKLGKIPHEEGFCSEFSLSLRFASIVFRRFFRFAEKDY